MSCPHISGAGLRPPSAAQSVHREDCTQCFDSIDDPAGLNVCLSCFNGGCAGEQRNHAGMHYQLTQHPLVVNIKRTKKQIKERDEPPKKISRLAIEAETEEDIYDTRTAVHCYDCGGEEVPITATLKPVVEGVLSAMTSARQNEVKAWEQEITPCEHTLCLEQHAAKQLESQALATCSQCDLKENLWLCLECGALGCGRAQYGGVGGNGHALSHYESAHHPVAVKLGSITPEGTADIYCYACNDERTDPELAKHLAHWGINIAERQKTEKSLVELQVEQNLKWDFSMTTEDGKELKPLFGAGLTGLKNLGNSCYLNSILQCLFSLEGFKNRYFLATDGEMPLTADPAEDLETQLRKVADGILSGRYATPDSDIKSTDYSAEIPHQKGLRPAMLKTLIGRGHEEFSTMRQQDAFELLLHLFKLITRSKHTGKLQDPVDDFRFVLEQRLQCLGCKKVSYRSDVQDNISVPVPVRRIKQSGVTETGTDNNEDQKKEKETFEPVTLKECMEVFTGPEIIEYTCKGCGGKDGAVKRSLFKTFPKVLAVNCRRFELVNWVPTKLDIPVVVGDEPFLLDSYKSSGLQPGEELLPEDNDSAGSQQPSFTPNAEAMAQLEGMGFPAVRCGKALYHTGNSNAEDAMNWLFGHMEDADIDEPLKLEEKKGDSGPSASPEQIEMLTSMGFTTKQASKALKSTENNVERAVEWLFSHPDDSGEDDSPAEASDSTASKKEPGRVDLPAEYELDSIVCHKGGSIHAGHYVAFVRKLLPDDNKNRSWVLFNDEKVVKAADVDEMKKFAYVYFFRRNTGLGA